MSAHGTMQPSLAALPGEGAGTRIPDELHEKQRSKPGEQGWLAGEALSNPLPADSRHRTRYLYHRDRRNDGPPFHSDDAETPHHGPGFDNPSHLSCPHSPLLCIRTPGKP